MTGIKPEDRAPMAAAIAVLVLSNIIGYSLRLTIYISILAAPLAIIAFMIVRYLLYGSMVPEVLRSDGL